MQTALILSLFLNAMLLWQVIALWSDSNFYREAAHKYTADYARLLRAVQRDRIISKIRDLNREA